MMIINEPMDAINTLNVFLPGARNMSGL